MNKELIKKYKAEFDHWLNGGELLSKHPDETNWYLVTVVLWNCPKMQYIINDEYVEFRQALAEGKTIQYNPLLTSHNRWDDIKKFKPTRDCTVANYRIKPEEPKFKVGDWVRDLRDNRIFQINAENFNLKLSTTNGVYTHWQPKQGALVIFKDKNSIISIIKYNGETNVYPFIGEITWLHKKD